MAFPKHPIIDVNPVDAARGAAIAAGGIKKIRNGK